jgi:histidinol-phosphatase (PHP family)
VYPLPRILLRARELGVRVTLGDDSHGPHDVGEGLDACVAALAQAGYREVHLLDRAEGRVVARAVPLTEVQPTGAS